MKRKLARLVAAVVMAGVPTFFLAGTGVANSASFAWTMNLRFVHGKKNGQLHSLDAGELTLSGKIWIHEKAARTASSPDKVTVEVLKDTFLDNIVCTVEVTPSTTLNSKKEYSKACGRVESGKYWLRIYKPKSLDDTGDGWRSQSSGTLTTTQE